MSVQDKVVLITGSSSGIGAATVKEFAKLGSKVVVHGRNLQNIEAVAQECQDISPNRYKPLIAQYDLDDEKQVRQLLNETIKYFGKLDVLVNNAAIYQQIKIDDEKAYEVYKQMVKSNLDQVILLTSLAIPYLRSTKGCIVNVSSNLHCKFIYNSWAYGATKAALINFTKSIAVDLAPEIRVNSVSPGPVATPIHKDKLDAYRETVGKFCLTQRIGESFEIARVILFLSTSDSGFITGTDMIVDGGATIKP